MDGRVPLRGQLRQGVGEPSVLATDGRGGRTRFGPSQVSPEGDLERQVEDDGDRRTTVSSRHAEQLGTRPRLDVGRVDHGEAATSQAHGEDAMEQVERVVGGGLRVRIVGDHGAQRIGREDLGGGEVAAGEGRLAAGRDADQQHQRISRDYLDQAGWLRKAVTNTALSGFFSTDRTIKEYNEKIWKLK